MCSLAFCRHPQGFEQRAGWGAGTFCCQRQWEVVGQCVCSPGLQSFESTDISNTWKNVCTYGSEYQDFLGFSVWGSGAVSVTVSHHVWDWCLYLGTGGKVEIGCWSLDRTLKGWHDSLVCWILWAKDRCLRWPLTPDQSRAWWVFGGRVRRVRRAMGVSSGALVAARPGFR